MHYLKNKKNSSFSSIPFFMSFSCHETTVIEALSWLTSECGTHSTPLRFRFSVSNTCVFVLSAHICMIKD
uniref:Uncharacterized protein n=1 Tax=Anguilla anguilla TaxID=7936 RepID=A0A0E9WK20_ANGAN